MELTPVLVGDADLTHLVRDSAGQSRVRVRVGDGYPLDVRRLLLDVWVLFVADQSL
jgi:hypothetical protein